MSISLASLDALASLAAPGPIPTTVDTHAGALAGFNWRLALAAGAAAALIMVVWAVIRVLRNIPTWMLVPGVCLIVAGVYAVLEWSKAQGG